MRLLNVHSGLMQDFISDDEVPKYAILSHTWESDQEVSFQQWENRETFDISHKRGFVKIENFRAKAASHGFEWIWVDTFVHPLMTPTVFRGPLLMSGARCCIDKKSSAELSEAINSMFRWYQNAARCYVYFADVISHDDAEELASSRWFTRGWTLQELIAPRSISFYTASWEFIGTKSGMRGLLGGITGIDVHILTGGDLETISVARRMSWASRRKTSRVEDMAYSLFGIFDVSLPLIYGEGRKAFQRLQEAIMIKTHDQSLFAWGHLVHEPSDIITDEEFFGVHPLPWKSPEERDPSLGLFADTVELFQSSSGIKPIEGSHRLRRKHPPSMVSGGVLLGLVILRKEQSVTYLNKPEIAVPIKVKVAMLLCEIDTAGGGLVGLVLRKWGEGYYGRTSELIVLPQNAGVVSAIRNMVKEVHIQRDKPWEVQHGDIVYRRRFTGFSVPSLRTLRTSDQRFAWRGHARGDREAMVILHPYDNDAAARLPTGDEYCINETQAVWIFLQRVPQNGSAAMGPLRVEVYLTSSLYQDRPVRLQNPDDMRGYSPIALLVQEYCAKFESHWRTMQAPCDSWALKVKNYPQIFIKAERKALEDGQDGVIDIIDFYMYPPGLEADLARRAIRLRESQ